MDRVKSVTNKLLLIPYFTQMQIDKLRYNIASLQTAVQCAHYISHLSQESLEQVHQQLIKRVNDFNPDDSATTDQIRTGFELYVQLMANQTFGLMPINDGAFICSLAFYLNAEKDSQCLARGVHFIEHQYLKLGQNQYAQSINLFKALLQVYEAVSQEKYESLTGLMLKMVVQNIQLLSVINHKYYFLQCLIQIVNQEQNVQQLATYFAHIRKLYSSNNTLLLFHSVDLHILVDILLRTLINQNQSQIIQQTLKLYSILSLNPVIAKDHYRAEDFHSALKQKMNFINQDQLDKSLQNIIHQILNYQ